MATFIMDKRDPATETMSDNMFIPARRFGMDEELAGTFIYLASPAGGYINGNVLLIDGGRLGVTLSTY